MSTNSTSINIKSTAAEKVATSEKIMMVIADRVKELIRQKNVTNNRTDGRPYYFTTNIDTVVYGRWITIIAIYNDEENPEIRRFHVDAFQSFTSEDDRSQRGMFQISSNNPGDVSISEFSPYFIRKVSERLPSEDNLEQMTDEELARFLSKFTASGVVNVGETVRKYGASVTQCATFIPEGELLGHIAIDQRYISQRTFVSRDMMRASDKKLAYELVGKKLENKEDKPHRYRI